MHYVKPAQSWKGINLFLLLLIGGLFFSLQMNAQTFPQGFSRVRVANGISAPTVLAFAPDGRIFLAQQNGALRIIKNGALLATPFIQLSVNSAGERGLIGIALDPNFSSNQYVYLYYTLPDGSRNRISRFTGNGDVVVPGSEVVVLNLDPLSSATNHNGGAMHFGSDGKLYVAIGENANGSHAQNLETYHGKLLRINADGSIPSDNPLTGSDKKRRIWASGLRNPYTFDIQSGTGRVFLNDVGQNTWEEINDATTGGKNFGWPTAEGNSTNTSFANPVFSYAHGTGDGKGCAITGGVFFNPATTNYPANLKGKYFYQDLCNKWINYIDLSTSAVTRSSFATGLGDQALSLDVGQDGNLYYLERSTGALYKIVYTQNAAPSIVTQPSNVSVSEGQPASFSVTATGTAPLSYQWQKNNVNITGANAATYSIAATQASSAGTYRVIVSNAAGSITSNNATLTVTAFNAPPVAQINTPTAGTLYRGGAVINFSGDGSDPEDGALPASAFSWSVVFHHDTHTHDGPPVASGVKSGSFTIPVSGEVSANVWYNLILTVTDSKGLKKSVSRDIFPAKSTITMATQPAGLQVTLDAQPVATPLSVQSVEGIQREIGIVSPQTLSGVTYEFDRWLHGGANTQTISTPTNDITYTAVFRIRTGNDLAPGVYNLIAVHSNKYLDVSGASTANNAGLVQRTNTSGNNQRFRIQSSGNGFYGITALHSNKAIEVTGKSLQNGARITQNVFTGEDHQLWILTSVGTGVYTIKNKLSQKNMDVNGASTQDGATVIQWGPHTGNNQKWRLVFISSLPAVLAKGNDATTMVYPNPAKGTFTLDIQKSDEKVNIDVINTSGLVVKSFKDVVSKSFEIEGIHQQGLYTIRITSNSGVELKKVLIE